MGAGQGVGVSVETNDGARVESCGLVSANVGETIDATLGVVVSVRGSGELEVGVGMPAHAPDANSIRMNVEERTIRFVISISRCRWEHAGDGSGNHDPR